MPDPIQRNVGVEDLTDRFVTSTTVIASPTGGTITEIAAVTWTPQSSPTVVSGVRLAGTASVTVGTNGVTALLVIRRTSTSGTVVASSGPVTVVATDVYSISCNGFDSNAVAPGQVYMLCLTVGSGSATSTVGFAYIEATII